MSQRHQPLLFAKSAEWIILLPMAVILRHIKLESKQESELNVYSNSSDCLRMCVGGGGGGVFADRAILDRVLAMHGQGHCVVFLDKKLYFVSFSLHSGV